MIATGMTITDNTQEPKEMKNNINKFWLWIINLCDSLIPDKISQGLFRFKELNYALGGALLGGAVQSGFERISGFWITISHTFILDISAISLVGFAGILFAHIGRVAEKLNHDIEDRIIIGDLKPSDVLAHRLVEEEQHYPDVKWPFMFAIIFLVAVVPVLLMGHKPTASPKHPTAHIECNPCSVIAGEPLRLIWDVDNATNVFLNKNPVNVKGYAIIRPRQNMIYYLLAENDDGMSEVRVTINVLIPTSTPTVRPTPQHTPTFSITQTVTKKQKD